jgi:hypothetical protein
VDAVDHQVDVRMARVTVRDDQRLVLPKSEVGQQPVGNAHHRRAIDVVVRVEREGDVVDRLLDPVRLRRGRAHEEARRFRIVRRQIARFDPGHPVGVAAVPAVLEVPSQT